MLLNHLIRFASRNSRVDHRLCVSMLRQQSANSLRTISTFHNRSNEDSNFKRISTKWSLIGIGSIFLLYLNDRHKWMSNWIGPSVDAFAEPNVDTKNKYFNMNFIADIVEQKSNSVVFIECTGRHPFYSNSVIRISSGSGFLVDKSKGIILTNAHVVADASKVTIKFNNGRSVDGHVEFVNDRIDLATIHVPLNSISDVEELNFADSKRARAGEWVVAVGSPFSLSNTVTVGVISSISRAARELGMKDNIDYIQTDASINIGNSGGPLLNIDGNAIGINTLKVCEGISFAIPSHYAIDFLKRCDELRQRRTKSYDDLRNETNKPVPNRKKYLGLSLITLTPNLIEHYQNRDRNFPNIKEGVMILQVVLGSPAHL